LVSHTKGRALNEGVSEQGMSRILVLKREEGAEGCSNYVPENCNGEAVS